MIMKHMGKKILFGVLLWLCIFVGSFFIFPFKKSDPVFFETLIQIISTFFAVSLTVLFFKKQQGNYLREGISVGLIWMIINLAIDIPLFSFGPMARPFIDYMKDIGLTYIIIPILTVGVGWLLEKKTT